MRTEFKPKKQETKKPEIKEPGQEITKLKNEEWGNQSPFVKELRKNGAKEFFRGVNFKKAFEGKRNILTCIDGGTAKRENVSTIAGNGIDWPGENDEERSEGVADIIVDSGADIDIIEIHPGCGKARKACERDNKDIFKNLNEEQIEKIVKKKQTDWAKLLKEKLKKKGKEVEIKEIQAEDMKRPIEIHNEGVVWYDTIGNFNPAFLDKPLQGFLVKRWGSKKAELEKKAKENACNELCLAGEIALGDHGFGEKFNEDEPLVFMVLAKNETELVHYQEEVKGALEKKFKKDLEAKKIIVDGFVPEGL